jgi:hypothetical protein
LVPVPGFRQWTWLARNAANRLSRRQEGHQRSLLAERMGALNAATCIKTPPLSGRRFSDNLLGGFGLSLLIDDPFGELR